MIGHGSPILTLYACARWMAIVMAIAALVGRSPYAHAEEIDVRLRFAWGSGGQSPQKWHGKISVAGGKLEALQPLGIEADEAASLRLVDNEIVAAPLVRRAFDGCDITVRGDETAVVTIELQSSTAAAPKVIEAPLGQLAAQPYRAPLDELGTFLLVHRAPGDKLRVRIKRDHLVFQPGEAIEFLLEPDLKAEAAKSEVIIRAVLRRTGDSEELWQTAKPYDAASKKPIALSLVAPAEEGAYRVSLVAKQPESFAGRLVPWDQAAPLASRDVELVVVDPQRRLPRLSDKWEVVSTIDPANSAWWQRIPQWTQFDKLPGFSTPRPLGNVKPRPVAEADNRLVELPTADADDEAAWQAYLLPVRRVGEPHAVEIELPRGVRQHLAVSVIEPDAAGRVLTFGRDCGVYGDDRASAAEGEAVEVHRIVFWPRTKSPALLLCNRSPSRAARYGKIKLLRRAVVDPPDEAADDAAVASQAQPARLVAAYLGTPRLAESLGAAEGLDPLSGLSIDGWNTFLTGANRLAQQVRAAGYNAAIVSIAADGSSLVPLEVLGASPRYDTGLLSAAGPDPMRKDVLEMLLRVFDREGLRLIPAVQLASPLPGLEAISAREGGGESGLAWIGHDGRRWSEHFPVDAAAAPHYNLLHAEVQRQLAAITDQLVARYGDHPAFGGLALQLAGQGYGVLPGLAWGMDDATAARFAADMKIALPAEGPERFRQRAELLLGPQLGAWKVWRQNQVTSFYAGVAARVARDRPELQLVLSTEELFAGVEATERVRQAVAGRGSLAEAFDEVGLDLDRLASAPHVTLLRPRRLGANDAIDNRALELRVNTAPELDQSLANQGQCGELFYHTAARLRLPSFDAQSPFGADKTYLALASPSVPAGDAAGQALIAALAGRDFITLAEGAEVLPLAENDAHVASLRAFQELPAAGGDVRTERRQPITLRVYREAESTTICLLNESPWPVDLRLPLDCDAAVVWRQLGADPRSSAADAKRPTTGSLAAGAQAWTLTLLPYGLEARRFSSRTLRVGAFTPQIASRAKDDLARRVAELDQRMASLDIERSYNELQNPQFELTDDNNRLLGWQPRGPAGNVAVAKSIDGSAGRAVHLRSQNALGVAVQSHLFPIPTTGQLVVRAKVRLQDAAPGTRMYAWVEYQSSGVMRQRPLPLAGGGPLAAEWTDCEVAVDDLPLGAGGQMRLQFHLAGPGQAWVDDVRLYDLRFTLAQRRDLVKRLYAAKTAYDEGQLMDCQREIDGYWPQRLVEHIPPPSLAARPSEARPPAPATDEPSKSLGNRIRGMVPRILR